MHGDDGMPEPRRRERRVSGRGWRNGSDDQQCGGDGSKHDDLGEGETSEGTAARRFTRGRRVRDVSARIGRTPRRWPRRAPRRAPWCRGVWLPASRLRRGRSPSGPQAARAPGRAAQQRCRKPADHETGPAARDGASIDDSATAPRVHDDTRQVLAPGVRSLAESSTARRFDCACSAAWRNGYAARCPATRFRGTCGPASR
jgi:hypothetical protein